ncbi:unnamed protein product [Moneuplotes crassus]|uniref:YTH domain-containing protein n=1 Tax=Euplotes crassus TaxID=5936 RepID=A0AAD1ULL0_EUPCR|nr:unnamed protein product [Moneuplotes crassus]
MLNNSKEETKQGTSLTKDFNLLSPASRIVALQLVNSYRLSLHQLMYRGIEKFSTNERLLTIYALSLLKPEVAEYRNGILLNPNNLLVNSRDNLSSATCVRTETLKNGKVEETKEKLEQDLELEKESILVKSLPTGHFSLNNGHPKVFLRLEKEKTCFMMIKSHSVYDVVAGLQNGIWSSTIKGNDTLRDAYEEFVVNRKGHVYLFFSVNKSGHLSAIGELVSNQIQEMPDIWLEKQKYSSCFLIRFILVKNVPMKLFSHLNNGRDVPLRRSRDTDRIGYDEGLFIMKNFINHNTSSSILFDCNLLNQYSSEEQKKSEEDPKVLKVIKNKNLNQLTPLKTMKPLSSSSPAYSPPSSKSTQKVVSKPPAKDVQHNLVRTYRPVEMLQELPARPQARKISNEKSMFSYGYYSERSFFGIYSG